ncbi:diguanylate cyclase [Bermanella marisrubri]|uniref:diguanylate cyclase n=1 Tax=Bermanella marisrubri TaxID=207949 RepID=Q1N175_9GAMM|nr:diguanylate cyclase [Bermanella marisrubri]EAT11976.1 diguanylate cyclase (GGDEF domain) [Oceanobacter sp. RED65] [Bermanella marisrubri]QIZ84780.1 diguanylate cyclase [Bermanella marisrubri]
MTHILIVDDVASNLVLLGSHLEDQDYSVIEATNGPQALDLLQSHDDIDLVLLDVEMPKMSGLEVLRKIKQDEQIKDLPVILVTANGDDQNVVDGLDLGAVDYVIKPYSLSVLLARVRSALREKERLDLMEKWATTDPLTGLYNRRFFFEQAQRELERVQRNETDASFIILDIDHFKKVNDEYGHLVGDDVLEGLAKLFKETFRKVDLCCRFGGEEFVICLPDTDTEGALLVAERTRKKVEELSFNTEKGPLHVTISLGVSSANENTTLEDMLKRADDALYQAKQNGRNRTESLD